MRTACCLALLFGLTVSPVAHGGPDYGRMSTKKISKKLDRPKDDMDLTAMVQSLRGRLDSRLVEQLLVLATRSNSGDVRLAVAQTLADDRGVMDLAELEVWVELLGDPEQRVRTLATDVLGQYAETGFASPELFALLSRTAIRSKQWQARRGAVLALADSTLDNQLASDLFLALAKNDLNPSVRAAAISCLTRRPHPDAYTTLLRIKVEDLDAGVRLAAERALSMMQPPQAKAIIAIMPFATSANASELAVAVEDALATCVATSDLAQVVERRQLEAVMDEARFADENLTDARALDLGRRLAANQVMTGTISLAGNQVSLSYKRVEIETFAVLDGHTVSGNRQDVFALARWACQQIKHGLVR